ncbi:hypothetical protein IWW55_001834, partial [Coemansia sp. RSA 2706]
DDEADAGYVSDGRPVTPPPDMSAVNDGQLGGAGEDARAGARAERVSVPRQRAVPQHQAAVPLRRGADDVQCAAERVHARDAAAAADRGGGAGGDGAADV